MDQEVLEARAKLAQRFNNATQIGGKGTLISLTQSTDRYPKKKEEAC